MGALIQQLLEASLRQGQVNKEIAKGLQSMRLAPAIPKTYREALHLLTKLGTDNDVEAFLATFERVARREEWPTDSWSRVLALLLMNYALSEAEAASLPRLRQEILDHCDLSPTRAASQFHPWVSNP